MSIIIAGQKYNYLTLRFGRGPMAGIDILGWGTYPRGSVLAGQSMKCFLDNVPDEAAARAWITDKVGALTARQVMFSNGFTEPQVSLSHLPGENDPVAGGMYPDDIGG